MPSFQSQQIGLRVEETLTFGTPNPPFKNVVPTNRMFAVPEKRSAWQLTTLQAKHRSARCQAVVPLSCIAPVESRSPCYVS